MSPIKTIQSCASNDTLLQSSLTVVVLLQVVEEIWLPHLEASCLTQHSHSHAQNGQMVQSQKIFATNVGMSSHRKKQLYVWAVIFALDGIIVTVWGKYRQRIGSVIFV